MVSVDDYRLGKAAREFNSCPGYFKENPSEQDMKPRLSGAQAFADLSENAVADDFTALVADTETYVLPEEYHARLIELIGLPSYGLGAGFRYVDQGKFDHVAWVRCGAKT